MRILYFLRKHKIKLIILLAFVLGGIFAYGVFRLHRYLSSLSQTQLHISTVTLEESNLPILMIDSRGRYGRISKENEITASLTIISNRQAINYTDTINHPWQSLNYTGDICIRLRGAGTLNLDKKSYAFKLIDSDGGKQKCSLLDMNKSAKWSLLALHRDGTMMRDALTFILARDYMDYVPDVRYCELIVDGEYQGIYLLTERISRDRLDIKKSTIDGPVRGVMLEKDWGECSFYSHYPSMDTLGNAISDGGVPIRIVYPKEENLTPKQKHDIEADFASLEDAIETGDMSKYSQLIDVDNLITYQLATEFSKVADAYGASIKIYKSNPYERYKLVLWDYDAAYGNYRDGGGYHLFTDRFLYNTTYRHSYNALPLFWWWRINQRDDYINKVKDRWREMRDGAYSNANIEKTIDSLEVLLTSHGAMARNSAEWISRWDHPSYNFRQGISFERDLKYLRIWIKMRLDYMDHELLGMPYDNARQDSLCLTIGRMMMYDNGNSVNTK